MRQRHLISIVLARNDMQTYDVERIISLCLRSNLRDGKKNIPSIGNAAHVALGGKWAAGFRMIGIIGPNGIVERGGKLSKMAMSQVRNADHTLEGDDTQDNEAKDSARSAGDVVL